MTEQIRTREALRTAVIHARSLIEASLDPLVTIGADGKITDVNAATEKATGFKRGELIGSDFSDYFTNFDAARTGYQQAFLDGEVRDYPLEIHHKDGRTIPVSYNATVYRNESGDVAGIFAAARDVTQTRKAERRLRHQAEKLRELSRRLSTAEENERKRLAAALHDLVGQNLTALGIHLELIRNEVPSEVLETISARLGESRALLENTIESIRNVMEELRPFVLDDFGFAAAARWLGGLFARRTGVAVTVSGGASPVRWPVQIETALFRILQEALTNVAKHANATAVAVTLAEDERSLRMTIRDNGIGFAKADDEILPGEKGWGMVMMAERAREAGAGFTIESQPGQGTRITVEVCR
jgi:PAS domain S-box-containing protein